MSLSRRASGFTLLELLIAITILGFLASILFGGLQFGTRVWKVGDRALENFSEVQTAYELMRRSLTRAVPLPVANATFDPASDEILIFEGRPEGIRFLGPAPAAAMPGSLYQFTLATEGEAEGKRLVLSLQPMHAFVSSTASQQTFRVVLLDGISDARFAYFGETPESGTPVWLSEWEDGLGLPLLISVQVQFKPGDPRVWPQLIVAPILSPPGA